MEPKNRQNLILRKPQLLRVYDDDGDNLYQHIKEKFPEKTEHNLLQLVDNAAKEQKWAYYDAGQLPEIVVNPPKDNAVDKIKLMIPNNELRTAFYDTIDDSLGEGFYTDTRNYINRLWQLYNKSKRPSIKPLSSRDTFVYNAAERLAQGLGLSKGTDGRPSYDPVSHTIYIDPEYAADDVVAELSHAYQFRGTDTPRNIDWMKQFISLPGDIVVNGKNGYSRPGNLEYQAHRIIQPRFNTYLRSNNQTYDQLYKSILRGYKMNHAGPKKIVPSYDIF